MIFIPQPKRLYSTLQRIQECKHHTISDEDEIELKELMEQLQTMVDGRE